MIKGIYKVGSVFLILILLSYGLFRISKLRDFQFFGGLTDRVETDQKVVALTFDDAPTEYSDQVLETLAFYQVKGTFYVIGANIEKYPELTRTIIDQGHEVGNHSYSHPRFLLKSWGFIDKEIQSTNDLIRKAGFSEEITFRPPTGKKLFLLPLYLKQHDMKTIMWDVEPDTYVHGDKEAIVEFVLTHTKPGSIILMHPFCGDACLADREALPQIIEELREQGYQFVTVTQLLELKKS